MIDRGLHVTYCGTDVHEHKQDLFKYRELAFFFPPVAAEVTTEFIRAGFCGHDSIVFTRAFSAIYDVWGFVKVVFQEKVRKMLVFLEWEFWKKSLNEILAVTVSIGASNVLISSGKMLFGLVCHPTIETRSTYTAFTVQA